MAVFVSRNESSDRLLGLGFRLALGFGRRALSLAPCLDATARATVDRFGPCTSQLPAYRASKQPAPERPYTHIHAQPILAGVSRRTEPPRAGIAMLPRGIPALAPSVTLPALDHLQAPARPSPRPPPDLGPPAEAVDGPLLPPRTVTVTATVFPIVYLICAATASTTTHPPPDTDGRGAGRETPPPLTHCRLDERDTMRTGSVETRWSRRRTPCQGLSPRVSTTNTATSSCLGRPTRLDKIKNLHATVKARGVGAGLSDAPQSPAQPL